MYTKDSSRSIWIPDRIEVGILGANHTLPSVSLLPLEAWNKAAIGREGSRLALEEFTETKYISVAI